MAVGSTASVVRGIGRWDLVALMVNITIGAGMLGLPAKLFELTRSYSLLVLILCAALVGVIAICFAEVGSRFVDSGGPYLIARTALGPASGFVVGWLYWISRVLTFATICNLLVTYAGRFVPSAPGEWLRVLIIVSVVGSITVIHLLGIRHATVVGNILTVLKISFLAAFGIAGLSGGLNLPPASTALPRFDELSDAMLLAVFAYVGFEASLVSAGETRNPRRDVPFAIAASLVIVMLLYLGAQAVCIATVPDLAHSETAFAEAAVILWGPVGEQLIAAGAIVIMLGSLNSGFLATTRLPFAFAEQGDLPSILARVHARFRTPHVAILCSAVLVLVATLASSFLSAITLATSTRMVVYIAGCAALIALRRRADAPPPGFVAPLGHAFAGLAIVLSVALLANASGRELIQLTIAAASGVAIYLLRRWHSSTRVTTPAA
jgi:basic amino acid/polyamine antiporter, APA family